MSNGSGELHHSYLYSSEHVFIALRWRSEMIMGFHEYTYQDHEYIIRAMNTKHAQSQNTCLSISRSKSRLQYTAEPMFVHITNQLAVGTTTKSSSQKCLATEDRPQG